RRPRPFRTTWTSSSSRSSHSRSHPRGHPGWYLGHARDRVQRAGGPARGAGREHRPRGGRPRRLQRPGIVNLTDAAGAGQPPTGGVNTGFGGTAPILWLAVIGAGLLLAVTGGIGLRRGRIRRLTT